MTFRRSIPVGLFAGLLAIASPGAQQQIGTGHGQSHPHRVHARVAALDDLRCVEGDQDAGQPGARANPGGQGRRIEDGRLTDEKDGEGNHGDAEKHGQSSQRFGRVSPRGEPRLENEAVQGWMDVFRRAPDHVTESVTRETPREGLVAAEAVQAQAPAARRQAGGHRRGQAGRHPPPV